MIDYQHAYLRGAGWSVADASLILTNDRRPCGLWPLSLGGVAAATGLTSQGEPIAPPLFTVGTSANTIKRIVTDCLDWLDSVSDRLGAAHLCREDARPGFADQGLSEFYQQSIRRGARLIGVSHDAYVDLRSDMERIRATWRKSYRPLVAAGLR
ncbi:MAG TPA: hypothetical protein VKV96_19630, partial [Roseiarcus sp.]|nr:hypothetical protein [Roseiarcus sp.]